jgi:hypothetical protein
LAFKIVKIYPHPVTFSLRFFKSDRLLGNEKPERAIRPPVAQDQALLKLFCGGAK